MAHTSHALHHMDASTIGRELRSGTDRWLRARRKIAAVAGALAAEFAVLGMRQYGIIRRLPDLPLRGFDANAVTTAPSAYPFGIPDATLAVTGLGAISVLATAGGTDRPRIVDLALGSALAIGAGGALYYLDNMIRKQRRLCVYCLAGATGFFTMAALAIRGRARA